MSVALGTGTPRVDGLDLEVVPPHTVRLRGTITVNEPSRDLTGFFRSLHQDAVARRAEELCVDVTELTFVNSSSIRLFIDWAVWVSTEPQHKYVLKFRTHRQITWQQTAFSALSSLMKEVVRVERT